MRKEKGYGKLSYLLIQKKGSKVWKMVLGRPLCDPNLTAQRSLSFDGYGRSVPP